VKGLTDVERVNKMNKITVDDFSSPESMRDVIEFYKKLTDMNHLSI
jgi:hypothetical protein